MRPAASPFLFPPFLPSPARPPADPSPASPPSVPPVRPQHDDTEYGATVDANGRHSGGPFYVEVSQKMTVQDLRKEIRVRRRRPPPARLLSPR